MTTLLQIPRTQRYSTWLMWALPSALAYGILSRLCWPSTYATSHMIIDYHFGFGKRGLLGSLLALIDHPPYHYVTLAWTALAILALWLVLLLAAARALLQSDTGLMLAFTGFFLSAGFASLVRDVARGEHLLILISIHRRKDPASRLSVFQAPGTPVWPPICYQLASSLTLNDGQAMLKFAFTPSQNKQPQS